MTPEVTIKIKDQIEKAHLGQRIDQQWQFFVIKEYIFDRKGVEIEESLVLRGIEDTMMLEDACFHALDYYAAQFGLIKLTIKDRPDQVYKLSYGESPISQRNAKSPLQGSA